MSLEEFPRTGCLYFRNFKMEYLDNSLKIIQFRKKYLIRLTELKKGGGGGGGDSTQNVLSCATKVPDLLP